MPNLLDALGNIGQLFGFSGDAGWELVKLAWTKFTQQTWTELYIGAFEQAFEEIKSHLQHSAHGDYIEFDTDKLMQFMLSSQIESTSLSYVTSSEFVKQLAKMLAKSESLIIGGHQLNTEREWEILLLRFVQTANIIFRSSIVKNEDAFRHTIIEELLVHQHDISNVQKFLSAELNIKIDQLVKILIEITSDYYNVHELINEPNIFPSGNISQTFSFYDGTEPKWSDIYANHDARRDIESNIITSIEAQAGANGQTPFGLILGREGDGKSTLLMRTAATLIEKGYVVYWHKDSSADFKGHLFNQNQLKDLKKRIVICIDNIHRFHIDRIESFLREFNKISARVFILATARTNIWFGMKPTVKTMSNFMPFELGDLSTNEINAILDKLETADSLGELKHFSRPEQLKRINDKSKNQLLVTLLEAKYNEPLVEIVRRSIRDIHEKFGGTVAEACYLVSAAHTFEIEYPRDLLERTLGLRSLKTEVLSKTQGFLVSLELSNHGLKTRHSIIASVLFETDDERHEHLENVIENTAINHSYTHPAIIQRIRRDFSKLLEPVAVINMFEKPIYVDYIRKYVMTSLAYFSRDTKQFDKATHFFREAITLNPNYLLLYVHWAQMEAERKNYEVARSVYERATKIKPAEGRTWANWGRMEHKAKNYPKAREVFRQGVELVPSFGDLWRRWYYMELELSNYSNAQAILKEALEKCSIDPQLWMIWGNMERERGNYTQAEMIFREAIEKFPANANLWSLWGITERERGNYTQAEIIFREATEKIPNNPEFWKEWGIMERERGNYTQAEIIFREAIEKFPTNANLWSLWGITEREHGNYTQAEKIFREATEKFPTDVTLSDLWVNVWKSWAIFEYEQKKYKAAAQLFRRATELKPRDEEAWILWATMEEERENREEANRLLNLAINCKTKIN